MMLAICSRMVVPYDHSNSSKKALEMAMTLAAQDEKIEVNVLMVIQPEIPAASLAMTPLLPRLELQHEGAQEIRKEIEQKLESLPNKTRTYVLDGDPAQVIEEFARVNDADFIVIGSRGLSGLKEMFLGSVSNHVLHKATCPVLVVK
ncbi:Nucleotide-binding universal stress protein, UspA family [Mesobacillus persicus]|uniref:Nucleotide-binding universal stress protein, UspA family n=2 Tax=Mesobacillus persicus TaxID=930146 RepID=A0A1H8IQB4_9BACI|nr:Nucleotide-binding universal stress protein, UspA family [Mesobacillus persicus]